MRAADVHSSRPWWLASKLLGHLCRRGIYAFHVARSYGVYTDAMVRAMTLLKYYAVTPLSGWFAARLADLVARQPEAFAADVVVPVPLHPTRLRERAYITRPN